MKHVNKLLGWCGAVGCAALVAWAADQPAGTCPASQAACSAAKTAAACPADASSCCSGNAGSCCSASAGSGCSAGAAGCDAAKSDARLTRAEYKVEGMMGQGCEAKVTQALAAVSGVSNPSACAKSGLVKVSYEPGVLKEKQVMAALKKAGLKVQTETLAVNLEGLQSGACSSKVSEALTAIRGVQDQKVCHQGQRAVVTFNPQEVTGHEIVAAIRKTGFKVVL